MAVTNFWLQMRTLRKETVEPLWAHWASAADLAVISGLLLMQGDPSGKSFAFYFPAIVAYSLVFPMQVTAILTAAVVSFVCWLSISGTGDMTVVARALTLVLLCYKT